MPTDAPDESILRRFLLGDLPADELEAVGRFLDAHPELVSTLHALRADDTLLTALRTAAPADLDPAMTAAADRAAGLVTVVRTPADAADPTADPDPVDGLVARLGPPRQPGDLGTLGGYRVVRLIGRGGMGAVFEAADDRLGRRVAIKVVLPTAADRRAAAERFARETRAAAAVEHDHIVPVYGAGAENGLAFLAMPLLAGETLADRLAGGRPVPLPELLAVGRQVADGLAAAHAAGLVHRDIKPSNIWLERHPDGRFKRVRVLDFGLAKQVAAGGADDLTRPGAVMGTPAYMAPEQAQGRPADARADLFSLGCVLYQMATGTRPFRGVDSLAVLAAVLTETPPPAGSVNPAVPLELSALIGRLLSKDPAGRPASARAVFDQLGRITADPPAETAAWPEAGPVRPRRRAVWVAAGVIGLVGVAVTGVIVVKVKSHDGKELARVTAPEGSKVEVGADGAVTVTLPPEPKAVAGWPPVGERPPAREADPGELVFYETFDDPKWCRLPVGEFGTDRFAVADGRYVMARTARSGGDSLHQSVGPPVPFGTAALRLRVTGGTGFFNFRNTTEGNTGCWLALFLDEAGSWRVWLHARSRQRDEWGAFLPSRSLAEGSVPVATDGWVNVAARWSETGYEVWLNGSRVAGGPVPVLGGVGADWPVQIGGFSVAGPVRIELDYAAVWRSDSKPAESPSPAPAGPTAAQRKALEWVLAAGGKVSLTAAGKTAWYAAGDPLPAGPVAVERVRLSFAAAVADDTLDRLRDLPPVAAEVELEGTAVTDAGLAKLAAMPNLAGVRELRVGVTAATDRGLDHLAKFRRLEAVELRGTKATASGVAKLAAALPKCKVTWDGGVVEPGTGGRAAKQRAALEWVLSAGGWLRIDGREVRAVRDLPPRVDRVGLVYLHRREVPGGPGTEPLADADLARLADLPPVDDLDLFDQPLTDAGLAALTRVPFFPGLRRLALGWADFTDAGLAALAGCPDLEGLTLYNCPGVTGAGLKHLAGLKRLTTLDLNFTPVAAEHLDHLRGLPLTTLGLARANVGDADVARLTAIPSLAALDLPETRVGDAGLAGLVRMPALRRLILTATRVTDAGLAGLGETRLEQLWLDQLPVTDAGLAHLARQTALTRLVLTKTKVTAAGVNKLAAALPKCQITWDGGTVEPAKK